MEGETHGEPYKVVYYDENLECDEEHWRNEGSENRWLHAQNF